ncbi:MAG: Holliday junction resolvase RuvX [Sphingobacteriales bacterium]|nr:MAG: Holliday junction resolvase RuvX [Sphingobacteriales bacterium]
MARILALDYGKKRTGIAVTDPMQIIATPLQTVETRELVGFLKTYFAAETVEKVLIGYPLNLNGTPTDATPLVEKFIGQFRKLFAHLPIDTVDERFSSKMASASIQQMGLRKGQRAGKGLIDQTAACILLQDHLSAR